MAYSEKQKTELFDSIINGIVDGKSVRSILKGLNMPSFATLLTWIEEDEVKLKQYTRAKEESADTDADNVTNIAERVLEGEIDPSAGRVAMDAYKWSSGKKKPKKYGDKLELEHRGEIKTPTPMTPELIDKIVNGL